MVVVLFLALKIRAKNMMCSVFYSLWECTALFLFLRFQLVKTSVGTHIIVFGMFKQHIGAAKLIKRCKHNLCLHSCKHCRLIGHWLQYCTCTSCWFSFILFTCPWDHTSPDLFGLVSTVTLCFLNYVFCSLLLILTILSLTHYNSVLFMVHDNTQPPVKVFHDINLLQEEPQQHFYNIYQNGGI